MSEVESWAKVRSLMRSRRLVEVITTERGFRLNAVRRSGQPQTICVPKDAGPVPQNLRDVQREFRTGMDTAGRIKTNWNAVSTTDGEEDDG